MTITVHRPQAGPRNFDDIGRMLGLDDPPAVAERHLAPSIWKHGRIHNEATQWLEHWYGRRRNADTAYRYAVALAGWLRHLDGAGKTVHDATAEDYRAYEALNRFPADGSDGITSSSWDGIKTVIKQFHEWLFQTWGTELPFPIEAKYGPYGTVYGIPDAGRRTKPAPSVVPLDPDHLDAVLMAAKRPTATGQDARTPRRDMAIIAWMAGTGMRVTPTSLITVYEVPKPTGGPYDLVRTPAEVNKYKRGVHGHGFASRLDIVRSYVAGERQVLLDGTSHDPDRPLHVVEDDKATDTTKVTFTDIDGRSVTRPWDHLTADQRLRLVTPDGHTPILFTTSTGRPMSTRTIAHVFHGAAKHCADRPGFPDGVHPHSCRHTYATYLATAYYRADPDLYWGRGNIIRFNKPEDAVKFTQRNLGHTSEQTTLVYTRHVELLSTTDLDRIKGVA